MKPLTCAQAQLLLGSLATEPVDAPEAEALDAHLAGCEPCRLQAEAFFRQDRALAELALVTEPLLARIRQGLPGAVVPFTTMPRRSGLAGRWWAVGIAASVLLAFGAWFLLRPHGSEPRSAQVQVVEGEVYLLTAKGKTLAQAGELVAPGNTLQTVGEESLVGIVYADGTRLEVGADSTLTQLSGGTESAMRVFLAEGYLTAEVANQPPGQPMVLATPRAEVVARGSKFGLSGGPASTHLETIEGVAHSTRTSDGQSIEVTAGFDVVVRSDDKPLAPQRVLRFYAPRTTLSGYTAAAFSPDGRTLATWAPPRSAVTLWDVASGQQRDTLKLDGQAEDVTDLAFSADGKSLTVLAGKGKTVTRWDLGTQQQQGARRNYPAKGPISFDGETLATLGDDGSTVMLWDLSTGQLKSSLRLGSESTHPVMALAAHGQAVAVSSGSRVTVWDLPSGQVRTTLDVHPARIQRMTFSPDGAALALRDGVKVTLWDVAARTRRAVFQNLVRPAGPVAFAPEGRTLATACGTGENSTVKLWDVPPPPRHPTQEKDR